MESLAKARREVMQKQQALNETMEEERKQMPCLKIQFARFIARPEQWIEDRYKLFVYSERNVQAWVVRVLTAFDAPTGPEPPSVGEKTEHAARPPWFTNVCGRRTDFEQCGFVFGGDGCRTYYKFMFARQAQPAFVYFQPMSRMPEIAMAVLGAVMEDHEVWGWLFDSERGEYSKWDQMACIQHGEAVSILTEMVHVGGRHAATDIGEAVPIATFIASLPPLEGCEDAEDQEKASGSSRAPAAAKARPWMTQPLATIGFAKPPSSKEQEIEYVDILDKELKSKMT